MGDSQCVKNFGGQALMAERREVDPISVPQARIAKLGEPPEVHELQTEVVGNAAQQLVVDRGSAPQPPEQRHGAEIAAVNASTWAPVCCNVFSPSAYLAIIASMSLRTNSRLFMPA